MTSANPSGMPILYKDEEAIHYLDGIADYFLANNREILHPVDDSVVQINDSKFTFYGGLEVMSQTRLLLIRMFQESLLLAVNKKLLLQLGEMNKSLLGPHIGDLENIETISHYQKELDASFKWIDIPKKSAVIDAHPYYQVQNLVKEYDFTEVIEVQHHHAHMAACIGENHLTGKTYGIILDGTGYGLDGNIWGFEISLWRCR